jgi:hypothetical protein
MAAIGHHTQNDGVPLKQRGNANEYAVAKLRRDRPDIHKQVLAGEIVAML